MDAKQLKCIEILVKKPELTDEQISKECSISRTTLWSWKKNQDFQTALRQRLDEEWKSYRTEAQKLMYNLAKNGNYQAVQYILDSNGLKATEKIEQKVETTIIGLENDNS